MSAFFIAENEVTVQHPGYSGRSASCAVPKQLHNQETKYGTSQDASKSGICSKSGCREENERKKAVNVSFTAFSAVYALLISFQRL